MDSGTAADLGAHHGSARGAVRGFSYYYVRVVQKDAEMAWSSPVWLGSL
jgi:hypothetical protein